MESVTMLVYFKLRNSWIMIVCLHFINSDLIMANHLTLILPNSNSTLSYMECSHSFFDLPQLFGFFALLNCLLATNFVLIITLKPSLFMAHNKIFKNPVTLLKVTCNYKGCFTHTSYWVVMCICFIMLQVFF